MLAVGTVEIVCGTLVILGLLTRLAAIPLIVIMVVAIVSTKLPIWAGHDLWIFPALPDGSAERPFWQRGALAAIGYLMAGARARRHGR